jgi:NADH:ubiquinone oxidoreductase subunit K
MGVGLTHFLVLSTALLVLGLYGVLVRRHALAILMSAELMLGASVLALAAFARFNYQPARPLAGQAVAIFVIGVALVQALVGTALALALPRQRDSVRQEGVPPTSAARDRIE